MNERVAIALSACPLQVLFLQSIGHGGGSVMMINRRNIATLCPLAAKPGKDEMRVITDMLSEIVDRDAAGVA